MKKILVLLAVLLVFSLVGIVFLANYALKAKNGFADSSGSDQICFSQLSKLTKDGGKEISFADQIVFSSVDNFKRGLSDDLPADFELYHGIDSDKIYSFPAFYEDYFDIKKGIIFASLDEGQKIVDFYLDLFREKGWHLEKKTCQDGYGYCKMFFLKNNRLISIVVFNNLHNYFPSSLDLNGQSFVALRYSNGLY